MIITFKNKHYDQAQYSRFLAENIEQPCPYAICYLYLAHLKQITLIEAPAQLTMASEKWTLFPAAKGNCNIYVN